MSKSNENIQRNHILVFLATAYKGFLRSSCLEHEHRTTCSSSWHHCAQTYFHFPRLTFNISWQVNLRKWKFAESLIPLRRRACTQNWEIPALGTPASGLIVKGQKNDIYSVCTRRELVHLCTDRRSIVHMNRWVSQSLPLRERLGGVIATEGLRSSCGNIKINTVAPFYTWLIFNSCLHSHTG